MALLDLHGYEEGDFSAWTGTSGTPSAVNTTSHHGTWCMKVDSTLDGSYHTIADTATVYHRVFAKFTGTLPTFASFLTVEGLAHGSTTICWVSFRQNAAGTTLLHLEYYYPAYTSAYSAAVTLSADTWYCVEVKVVLGDAANGEYRVYLDGVEKITVTSKDTSGMAHADRVYAAGQRFNTITAGYIDCVKSDTSSVGCASCNGEEAVQIKENILPRVMPQLLTNGTFFSALRRRCPTCIPRRLP